MSSIHRLSILVISVAFVMVSTAVAAERGGHRAEVELTDGSKVIGQVLEKNARTIYVAVGGRVLALDRKEVKALTVSGEEEESFTEVKHSGLYRTGRGTVKSITAHVEHLAPTIVVVKTPASAGTGWFSGPEGYVITNHHVIANERVINITAFVKTEEAFKRKTYKKVKIVAVSPKMDLALLKIEEDLDLDIPQLYLGDSTELESGDEVFTIGNPLLLERSTHRGIISKTSRNYGGRLYLQTATPINPGNSGGPLFNQRGEVIGVVSMGYIFTDGLGFAIPSKYVQEFLDNVDAFAYDPSNPNTGKKYMVSPIHSTDGAIEFTDHAFVKTGPGVRSLTLADVTGDGAQEAFVVNNNKGEIGVIRRRRQPIPPQRILTYEDVNKLPPNEDFQIDSLPVQNKILNLQVADMTGDGVKDIVFYGDLDGLCLIPGQKNGGWGKKRKIARVSVRPRRDALRVIDLDGDGDNEIFALGRSGCTIVHGDGEQEKFSLNAAIRGSIQRYLLRDVTGDGRLDALFFCTDKHYATRLYRQGADGTFEQEELIESSIQGPVTPFEAGTDDVTVLTLEKGRNRLIQLSLASGSPPSDLGQLRHAVVTVPLASGAGGTDQFAVSDLLGDPGPEIVTSSRADNEFLVLRQVGDAMRIVRSPSPRQISGLVLHRTKEDDAILYSCSSQEGLFGVSRVEEGRVSYPRPINTEGKVELIYRHSLDEESPSLVWVEKRDGQYVIRKCPLRRITEEFLATDEGSIDVEATTLKFGDDPDSAREALQSKPSHLVFADFNGDALSDIVLYWAYSGKESLYVGRGDGHFAPVVADQEFIQHQQTRPLLTADINRDGRREVLLTQAEFVRVLRVDEKNEFYVQKQFNWKWGRIDRLVTYGDHSPPRLLAVSGDQARVVELDMKENAFSLLSAFDLSGLEKGPMKVADVDHDGRLDVLMLGSNVLQVLYQRQKRHTMNSRLVFSPRSDAFSYGKVHAAQLDGRGPQEVLLFDSRKAMMEIARPDAEGMLQTICRHRVFEKSIQQLRESNSYELPVEVEAGDVDGNGKPDLVFLLDDRVGIYLQGKRTPVSRTR